MSPEVAVMLKTAARVMTSHLRSRRAAGHPLGEVGRVDHRCDRRAKCWAKVIGSDAACVPAVVLSGVLIRATR